MMNKRGQVSVFIIVGIILIVIVVGGVFIFKNKPDSPLKVEVESYIQSCVDDSVERGIFLISFQGGYYEPKNSVSYSLLEIPYYFYLKKKEIPSKEKIENELSKYIGEELPDCIESIEGYEIKAEDVSVETSLSDEINVKINYPISVTKDGNVVYFKKFNYEKRFNFDKLYKIIKNFDEEHQKNPDFIPIGYLSLLAEENEFTFEIIYLSENEVIYSFLFTDLFESNLLFNFAAKYDWDLEIPEKKIIIEPIPRQTAYEGVEFSYKVELNKSVYGVMFDDYTHLFDINKNTGEIKFIPKGDDSGTYNILIKAYDNKGHEDTVIMILDVERNIEDIGRENV